MTTLSTTSFSTIFSCSFSNLSSDLHDLILSFLTISDLLFRIRPLNLAFSSFSRDSLQCFTQPHFHLCPSSHLISSTFLSSLIHSLPHLRRLTLRFQRVVSFAEISALRVTGLEALVLAGAALPHASVDGASSEQSTPTASVFHMLPPSLISLECMMLSEVAPCDFLALSLHPNLRSLSFLYCSELIDTSISLLSSSSSSLTSLSFHGTLLTDACLPAFARLPALRVLHMNDAAVSAAGLSTYLHALGGVSPLESLRFDHPSLDDAAASLLSAASFPRLTALALRGCDISDRCLSVLSSLPLTDLDVSANDYLTSAGLCTFLMAAAATAALTRLNLRGTAADDAVVSLAAALPLSALKLSDSSDAPGAVTVDVTLRTSRPDHAALFDPPLFTRDRDERVATVGVTDAGLSAIASARPPLTALSLNGCAKISAAGIAALRSLPSLTKLSLKEVPGLDSAAMTALSGFPALTKLNLAENDHLSDLDILGLSGSTAPVHAAAAVKVETESRRPPLTQTLRALNLSNCAALTDASLSAIVCMTALRTVHLQNPLVTGSGVSVLRSLPLQRLSLFECGVDAKTVAALHDWPTMEHVAVFQCAKLSGREQELLRNWKGIRAQLTLT